jgi:DMSO/TMAO reductase YedYZ molybdopterin-dependent catalytic subunit
LVAVLASFPDPAPAQSQESAPASTVVLSVRGDVPRPLELTAAEISRLPRLTVRAKDHEGKEAEFAGVAMVEVLKKVGVKFGQDLRGPALATYVVVEASDGYRAVFALAELDPAFAERVILLADQRDGKPLGAKEGPLRVIVPGEKRHARWVRQVIALKVRRA